MDHPLQSIKSCTFELTQNTGKNPYTGTQSHPSFMKCGCLREKTHSKQMTCPRFFFFFPPYFQCPLWIDWGRYGSLIPDPIFSLRQKLKGQSTIKCTGLEVTVKAVSHLSHWPKPAVWSPEVGRAISRVLRGSLTAMTGIIARALVLARAKDWTQLGRSFHWLWAKFLK